MKTTWMVEIDCWPSGHGSNHYYELIIEGLDEWLQKPADGSFFGDWNWKFETSEEDFLRLKPILFERLVSYYTDDNLKTHDGIRFLSICKLEE